MMSGSEVIEIVVLLPYPVALTWAMCSDLVSYRIPNAIPVVLLVGFLLAAIAIPARLDVVMLQLGLGVAALVVGMIIFHFGLIGGGDAKLLAAAVPWIDVRALPGFLLWMAVVGGILGLGVLLIRRLAFRGLPIFEHRGAENMPGKSGIALPYGVAIGCAGLITLPNLSLITN